MPIGSNILHRRSADRPGYPTQTLDPGKFPVNTRFHKPVPILACTGANDRLIALHLPFDAGNANPYDQAWKPAVGNEQVGTTAENEDRKVSVYSKPNRFEYGIFDGSANKVAGGTTYTKSR